MSKAAMPIQRRTANAKTQAAARRESFASGASTEGRRDYLRVYEAAPLERIKSIKEGVSAVEAKAILADLAISSGRTHQVLGIPVSTLNRKAKVAQNLSIDEGERILGLAKLVGQVQAMVQDSGAPKDFDALTWTAHWLNEPLPAFGGLRPIQLMDTMEGQGLVSDTLARAQSGAYA